MVFMMLIKSAPYDENLHSLICKRNKITTTSGIFFARSVFWKLKFPKTGKYARLMAEMKIKQTNVIRKTIKDQSAIFTGLM